MPSINYACSKKEMHTAQMNCTKSNTTKETNTADCGTKVCKHEKKYHNCQQNCCKCSPFTITQYLPVYNSFQINQPVMHATTKVFAFATTATAAGYYTTWLPPKIS